MCHLSVFSQLKYFQSQKWCWLADIWRSDIFSLPLTATEDEDDLEEVPGCSWRDNRVLSWFILTRCTFTVKIKGLANCVVQTSFRNTVAMEPSKNNLWGNRKPGAVTWHGSHKQVWLVHSRLIEVFLSHIFFRLCLPFPKLHPGAIIPSKSSPKNIHLTFCGWSRVSGKHTPRQVWAFQGD